MSSVKVNGRVTEPVLGQGLSNAREGRAKGAVMLWTVFPGAGAHEGDRSPRAGAGPRQLLTGAPAWG